MLRHKQRRWRRGWIAISLIVVVAGSVTAALRPETSRLWRTRPHDQIATGLVRHSDMTVSVSAAGSVASSNQTVIQCELQNLGGRGLGLPSGGASTIISVVPDGTQVKKGDVLCQLDASEYEEVLLQQQIVVEQARAEHRQAQLDVEVTKLALQEFKEGNLVQDLKQMRGQIALTEADLQRTADRLAWSRKMESKGYVSLSQVNSDQYTYNRSAFSLAQARLALAVFERFSAPRTIRTFETEIAAAESTFHYQEARLQLHQERLANLKRQVERCTIRAPHDGLVIHANEPRLGIIIQEGLFVRQKQRLFYLPDLSAMEVQAMLHESVVQAVRDGMPVHVCIDGLPGRVLDGHVVKVAQLPFQNILNDVRYFMGTIKLDAPARGLLPGMTAEVEILTDRPPGVLTIPPGALAYENGQEVCYVSHQGELERREIKVGQATAQLLEVTEGLTEGEQVVLEPENMDRDAVEIVEEAERHAADPDGTEEHPVTH